MHFFENGQLKKCLKEKSFTPKRSPSRWTYSAQFDWHDRPSWAKVWYCAHAQVISVWLIALGKHNCSHWSQRISRTRYRKITLSFSTKISYLSFHWNQEWENHSSEAYTGDNRDYVANLIAKRLVRIERIYLGKSWIVLRVKFFLLTYCEMFERRDWDQRSNLVQVMLYQSHVLD